MGRGNSGGSVGSTRWVVVTVSVTVLTDVETDVLALVLVLLDGAWVVVVVVTGDVVVVVTGDSVVVAVTSEVGVGDWVTVWVVPSGAGATEAEVPAVADVDEVDDVVDVTAGLDPLLPVNFTTA